MHRCLKNVAAVRVLHQTSRIHNSYAIGYLRNDGKIMRDEQHRQPEFLPKVGQQFQNLRLNRYVESRRGFIRNQSCGRFAIAMAMTTLCRMPPES